jgi:MerR family copper efflux transcriptional regulator
MPDSTLDRPRAEAYIANANLNVNVNVERKRETMADEGEKAMTIGQLATQVGKTPRALRLYEELGLIVPKGRSKGGFRLYGDDALARLRWVLELTDLGLPLADIQGMLADIAAAQTGGAGMDILRARYVERRADIEAQIRQLETLRRGLDKALGYLERCRPCTRGPIPQACHDCVQTTGDALPDMVRGLLAQPPADSTDPCQRLNANDEERS